MKNEAKLLKKYRVTFILLAIIVVISIFNLTSGISIIKIAGSNFKILLMIIPPIFIFIGLIDVWIPREVLIKHMGEDSGRKGLIYSFLLGTIAVGPLYAAFPIAALLLKKGVKYSNVTFFLYIWMSAKLPLVLVELSSMGAKFTVIHLVFMISIYLLGALFIEKLLAKKDRDKILQNIYAMEK